MDAVIDAACNIAGYAEKLAGAGVTTVIRYYNHANSTKLPSKCLTAKELATLHAAGLSVAVVFQQRGGASLPGRTDGSLSDLSAASGLRDATRALYLARLLGQPETSAIYFGVDHDFYLKTDLDEIEGYFRKAKEVLGNHYRIGVYGSGAVGRRMVKSGVADLIWLAGAPKWSGTQEVLASGTWALFQKNLERTSEIGGFGYDGNIVNPAYADFGQFGPAVASPAAESLAAESPVKAPAPALYRVNAKSGLNLRGGPDESYQVLQTITDGVLVSALGREGEWTRVDLEGDGRADGYMFGAYLKAVTGGLPLTPVAGQSAYMVARQELALDVREVEGPANNPRIVMYHATTAGGADADETAWCSSFVNYCVEQAGLKGTDSKAARSWHDRQWGLDVTNDPREGDIVVWRRQTPKEDGGHVGFLVSQDANSIEVLGGNQSNRVRIQRYPRNGTMGTTRYTLLSIRRQ